MNYQVFIIDDMISLYIRQEGMFRKARRTRRIQIRESDLNNAERFLNVVKSESELDFSILCHFSVRCKLY